MFLICDVDPVSLSITKISTSFPLILISDEVYFLPFRVVIRFRSGEGLGCPSRGLR